MFIGHFVYFWKNNLLNSFAHVSDWGSLLLSSRSSLYHLDINPLSDVWVAFFFTQSCDTQVFNFDEVQYLFFLVLPVLLMSYSIYYKIQCHETFPLFPSKSFVLISTFRTLIHLIFVYGIRYGSNFILFVWISSFPSPIC